MRKILFISFWVLIIGVLFYTRFVGLDWGLPYPMHPDERNMAIAVQNLHCSISNVKSQMLNLKECFNPNFFAYGQFPLYLGRFIVFILKFFDGDLKTPVSFGEAIISLRIISAIASIINVFVLLKIVKFLISNFKFQILTIFILIFSPYAIQFSHFGTTESLLMLFYNLIIYFSLKILKPIHP